MSRPRVRITVRGLMIVVAVAAMVFVDARVANLLVILATSAVAVWSLLAKPGAGWPRRWAVPYLVTLGCLYLPFGWVVWDYPWDGYRVHWIRLWPVLPGLVAGMLVHPRDELMILISGLVSLLLLALFTALGTRGRRTLVVANGLLLIAAGVESWIAYSLFLW